MMHTYRRTTNVHMQYTHTVFGRGVRQEVAGIRPKVIIDLGTTNYGPEDIWRSDTVRGLESSVKLPCSSESRGLGMRNIVTGTVVRRIDQPPDLGDVP